MPDFTALQFARYLSDLKLVDRSELAALETEQDLKALSGDAYIQLLLRRQLLTNYQVERLKRGERDGYFYGAYKVLYLISQGTFARVYRAVKTGTDEVVALKVLRKRFISDRDARERFRREGELGKTLTHPNIIRVHSVHCKGKAHFLVMEFVEGQNLRQFVTTRRKLAPPEATRLMKDIVSGLYYASTRGLTHRDLKLTNVLVTTEGRAKLIDFGLAGADAASQEVEVNADKERTIDYASLERATKVQRGDPRSDLFFTGCMYYHMLTGVAPLEESDDRARRLVKSRLTDIRKIGQVDPAIPWYVTKVVDKAMELQPRLRYQAPGEMLVDLAAAIKTMETEPDKPPPPAAPAEPEAKAIPEPKSKFESDSRSTLSKMNDKQTVVVCESNARLQDVFREQFKKHGFRILLISNLERALDRVEDTMQPVTALIINGESLGATAYEAFKRLRQNRATKRLRTVLIVGANEKNLKTELAPSHYQAILSMPLKMREVFATLSRLASVEDSDSVSKDGIKPPPKLVSREKILRNMKEPKAPAPQAPPPQAPPQPQSPVPAPPTAPSSAPLPLEAHGEDSVFSQSALSDDGDTAHTASTDTSTQPGVEMVDNYELLEELGQGGMGTVYRARHQRMDRIVAIKILSADRMSSRRAVARFHREIKAVARLNHPNIVAAHDAGESKDGKHYLVMEYVAGFDLSGVVKRCGPLPWPDACDAIRQAALALQHAHEHQMVHRDVKPSNLLLDPKDNQVKLLDLGLALLNSDSGEELTGSGQVLGTVEYMAPEQWSDTHSVDIRADIYSLGCTMYRLLCGHAPFSGEQYSNMLKKMMAHAQSDVPPLRTKRPDAPQEVQDIIEKMLAKEPKDRYQQPLDVAEALAPFSSGSDLERLTRIAQQVKLPSNDTASQSSGPAIGASANEESAK